MSPASPARFAACRSLVVLAAAIVLGSCSSELLGDPQADFADYRHRLERVFETAFPAPGSRPEMLEPRYPQRRDLQLRASEFSIGILDIFALDACAVGQLVAQRNSALGKLWPDSAQWRYEQAFLASVDACLQLLGQDQAKPSSLMQTLDEVRDVKHRELGVAQWNATFASVEFQQLFSTSRGPLPRDFRVARAQALARALERLTAYVEGEPTAALDDLESINAVLMANPEVGRVLLSVELMTVELKRVAETLETLFTNGDGEPCWPAALDDDATKIAINVLELVFVGRIQPYLVELQKAGHAWIDPLKRLAEAIRTNEQPLAFQAFAARYLQVEDGVWAEFQAVNRRHARLWTQVRASLRSSEGSARPAVGVPASEPVSDCSR